MPDPESERAFAAVMKAWAKRGPCATAVDWELACRQNFLKIRQRAWPVPHRQSLIRRFRREGLSYRAIAGVFGCRWNTIRHDCADIADDGEGPAVIVSLDGSQRRPPTIRPPSAVQ